jgi:hypothetical protein
MKRNLNLVFLILPFCLFSQDLPLTNYQKVSSPQSFLTNDGTLFVNEFYKLRLEGNEANVKYHYQWNEEPWTIFSEPMFPPVNGWNEIRFFGEDQLGNREPEQKINLYIDRTPPRINVIWKNLPKSWNENFIVQTNNEIKIRAIDDESGIENVFVSLDGGPETKVGKDVDWVHLTQLSGKHTLTAFTVDNVKNISKKIEINWLVDSTPPIVSLIASPKLIQIGDQSICARKTKLEITSKDALTETKDLLWRRKGTENWALTNKVFDLEKTFPFQNKIEIEFKALDIVGNQSAILDFNCTIDRTPPITTIHLQK